MSTARDPLKVIYGRLIKAAANVLKQRTWGEKQDERQSLTQDEALSLLALELRSIAEAIVSLAQPGEGALTGWQSIDSAPKDRTLLLWHPSYGTPVAGHVLVGELWGVFAPGVPMLFQKHLEPPTHWMPLPPPPGITSTPTGDSNG